MAHRQNTTFVLHRAEIIDRIIHTILYLIVGIFSLACLLPFWLVFINSLAQPQDLVRGFRMLPKNLTLDTYNYLIRHSSIMKNFLNSVLITGTGTVLSVLVSTMYAYGLAHPRVERRYLLSFLTYIPMILPYTVNPFYVFIMISFFRTLPYEIIEAAYIDGAGDLRIFFKVVWPLSIIPTVTITLFYALTYWNDWWLAMLYVNDTAKQPLQIMIRNITTQSEMASMISTVNAGAIQPINVQLATVCLAIGPIILLYPFLQRYFVRGVIVGAVKG